MFELILFATALVGSSLASAWDLKTTEVPDQIPYLMVGVALILHGLQSFLSWSYWPLLNSLMVGLGFLGFGFLMYWFGQWGGADAKILSAIGFLIPASSKLFPRLLFPFPISYLINVFLIGAAYMLIYAFIFALLHRKIISEFLKDVRASSRPMAFGSLALFLTFFLLNWYFVQAIGLRPDLVSMLKNSSFPLAMTIGLFVVWRFAKVVEEVGFTKRIPISKLKVGDILQEFKRLEGIDENGLKKIKRSKKRFVVIKEGVRFAPSFLLALLFTLYFGDGIIWVMGLA